MLIPHNSKLKFPNVFNFKPTDFAVPGKKETNPFTDRIKRVQLPETCA